MKETAIDVPWLKVFATGFKHGIKWGLASLLFELPILLGMLLGITSKEQAIWMAWGIPSLVAGLGCLLALMSIIAVAYMKHRWFRYLALMFIVLYFGSPVMLAIFLPYVGIYGFIAEPRAQRGASASRSLFTRSFSTGGRKFPLPCSSRPRCTPVFGDGLSRQRTRTTGKA